MFKIYIYILNVLFFFILVKEYQDLLKSITNYFLMLYYKYIACLFSTLVIVIVLL